MSIINTRKKRMLVRVLWVIDAILFILLCAVVAVCAADDREVKTVAPQITIQTVQAVPDITPMEDPEEDKHIFEAIMAKCQVVEDCYIVGYAPELIEGWSPEWRNEYGLYLTASGMWAMPGYCVATDPSIIPTGATVIINGKMYVAADRGVSGKVIDVMCTPEEALNFGCYKADVYWCMEGCD